MSDGIEIVRGKRALIRFDGGKCIHSRACVLGRPDVFVPNVEGDWIHPDAARPEELAELAHTCPSGAIRVDPLDGSPGEAPPIVNTVRVRENGPLAIHAEMALEGHPDVGYRATLCRCGLSKNKPFCDSSHKAGFVATGEPATEDTPALAVRGGVVSVKPAKNGPLVVSGNLELVSGTGRTLARVTKTALCRCGHSAKKPFCDGSHAKASFGTE
jgi:CDGSH-type Zn-finger protein/uncharacterized Fe-S cluster protein YjdI